MSIERPFQVGLALSGGAARCAAHIGILEAMGEKAISAVRERWWPAFTDPEAVLEIIEREPLFKKITFKVPHKSLFNFEKLFDLLSKYVLLIFLCTLV